MHKTQFEISLASDMSFTNKGSPNLILFLCFRLGSSFITWRPVQVSLPEFLSNDVRITFATSQILFLFLLINTARIDLQIHKVFTWYPKNINFDGTYLCYKHIAMYVIHMHIRSFLWICILCTVFSGLIQIAYRLFKQNYAFLFKHVAIYANHMHMIFLMYDISGIGYHLHILLLISYTKILSQQLY